MAVTGRYSRCSKEKTGVLEEQMTGKQRKCSKESQRGRDLGVDLGEDGLTILNKKTAH